MISRVGIRGELYIILGGIERVLDNIIIMF